MTADPFASFEFDAEDARGVLADALAGADDGEIFLETAASESLAFDDGRLKTASFDSERGFGLRGVFGETTGYAHTNDPSLAALKRAGRTATAARKGRDAVMAPPPAGTNVKLYDDLDVVEQPGFEAKAKLLAEIDAYLRARDPEVVQVACSLAASRRVIGIVRADGETRTDVRPLVRLNVSVTCERAGRRGRGAAGAGGRAPAGRGGGPGGGRAGRPANADNLVVRAAHVLRARCAAPGARIGLRKHIPVGAGLGGGSADAAATLVALNDLWACGLDEADISAFAAELGSDVPFCLRGGSALGTGRGEQLRMLHAPAALWFVLGISARPLMTAEVYRRWRGSNAPAKGVSGMLAALAGGDARSLAAHVHNDLEDVVMELRPELRAQRRVLEDAGALAACVSGSGPTLFALASGEAHASVLARAITGRFDRVEIVASVPAGVERIA
jgi:4-diphosphocytidyl-2C-methyl-D-erythritol kinase